MQTVKCGWDSGGGLSGRDLLIANGPTILVNIGFDPDYKATTPAKAPTLAITNVAALVDTGATISCIDSGLAMQLNLPIVDRKKISGSGGQHEVNMHLAQIHVPSLSFTIYGEFAGVDLIAGGQPHHALIGRTFLQQFTMVYEGSSGTVTLSR